MDSAARPDPDEQLARCRAGESDAWRALYLEHHEGLFRFVERMGTAPADVPDVVQEVFVVLHRRIGDFDGRVAFRTWLFGIAVRIVKNHRRKTWQRRLARLVGFGPTLSEDGADAESLLSRSEAAVVVDGILSQMKEKHRAVFVLFEVEGLDGHAISQILACPVPTVWSRLQAARTEYHRLVRQWRMVRGEEASG